MMSSRPLLFQEIEADQTIARFIVPKCEEEGICVEAVPEVKAENLLVIKVDAYYHAQGMKVMPPAVDCLIIQHCKDERYKLLIVELKNQVKLYHKKTLEGKFDTTLFDFISDRYRKYFYKEEYQFISTKLLLCAGKVKQGKLIRSYSLDFLLGLKLFTFQGKRIGINGEPPNPIIHPCRS